jgi:DNA-binding XRE family transcriptional regulator
MMETKIDRPGCQIRSRRIQNGMSQAVLSERAGVSRRTLARWESGKASPRRTELDLVQSALGWADDFAEQSFGWRRALSLARGRLGLDHESMGALLRLHASTVRRLEEGRLGVTADLAKERIRSLPLHPSELEAFIAPLALTLGNDWTNFDLYYDQILRNLDPSQAEWWRVAAAYGRQLGEAHRHSEARELAKPVIESGFLSGAPKTAQFAIRSILARSYFFDSWRSAQRGLYQLRQLKGLAVGRREICEGEALFAECLAFHGRWEQAAEHICRAVSIAEDLGGATLSLRQTDHAAILAKSGNPEAALAVLPRADSEGPVEFATRARLIADIKDALGDADRAEHWRQLAEAMIEREHLHGRFRLVNRRRSILDGASDQKPSALAPSPSGEGSGSEIAWQSEGAP